MGRGAGVPLACGGASPDAAGRSTGRGTCREVTETGLASVTVTVAFLGSWPPCHATVCGVARGNPRPRNSPRLGGRGLSHLLKGRAGGRPVHLRSRPYPAGEEGGQALGAHAVKARPGHAPADNRGPDGQVRGRLRRAAEPSSTTGGSRAPRCRGHFRRGRLSCLVPLIACPPASGGRRPATRGGSAVWASGWRGADPLDAAASPGLQVRGCPKRCPGRCAAGAAEGLSAGRARCAGAKMAKWLRPGGRAADTRGL